jgi:outer membrane protein
VFAQADFGFNGYSGFRGQIGADVIAAPAERLSISVGPRLSWAANDYMDTYFSVSDSAAAASGGQLEAFQADGGLRSVGVASIASYALTDQVFLLGNLRYDRLIGDAGDSPIVKYGSKNQWFAGVGISRKLEFNLFR